MYVVDEGMNISTLVGLAMLGMQPDALCNTPCIGEAPTHAADMLTHQARESVQAGIHCSTAAARHAPQTVNPKQVTHCLLTPDQCTQSLSQNHCALCPAVRLLPQSEWQAAPAAAAQDDDVDESDSEEQEAAAAAAPGLQQTSSSLDTSDVQLHDSPSSTQADGAGQNQVICHIITSMTKDRCTNLLLPRGKKEREETHVVNFKLGCSHNLMLQHKGSTTQHLLWSPKCQE